MVKSMHGIMMEQGYQIWPTPAVGDIDGDGKYEIAVVRAPWCSNDSLYVFKNG